MLKLALLLLSILVISQSSIIDTPNLNETPLFKLCVTDFMYLKKWMVCCDIHKASDVCYLDDRETTSFNIREGNSGLFFSITYPEIQVWNTYPTSFTKGSIHGAFILSDRGEVNYTICANPTVPACWF